MNDILELCNCYCTRQVHELGQGKCYNETCAMGKEKCLQFKGRGKLHASALITKRIDDNNDQ